MRGLEADHVILGPMRGLKKRMGRDNIQTNIQTQGHRDSMTDPAKRPESVKVIKIPKVQKGV